MATIKSINGLSAASNQTGSSIELGAYTMQLGNIGVQVIGSGLTSSDSTVTFQTSNDGTNWDDLLDSGSTFTMTMASGSTTQSYIFTNASFMYIRAIYTKNTNAGGTITVNLNLF